MSATFSLGSTNSSSEPSSERRRPAHWPLSSDPYLRHLVDRGSPVNARVELAPQVEISVHFLPAVCHVDCYIRPLLERIANGDIDPTLVISHRMTRSDAA
jgi:hypothetical protein